MRTLVNTIAALAVITMTLSCGSSKKSGQATTTSTMPVMDLDTLMAVAEAPEAIYHASETRHNDILHTRLEVSFDWEKQYLYGKAYITATPYFYPQHSIILDAKGMEIQEVSLVDSLPAPPPPNAQKDKFTGKLIPPAPTATIDIKKLDFTYADNKLTVNLGKEYKKNQRYTLYIKYTAKPNELKESGGTAITSDKGLYFINPDGSDKEKPRQIWTQGETESNSVWFPTIDKPNERMTTELLITVKNNFLTLSNGELIYQKENPDSTRTDCWKMDLPYAPYLVMMAIGEFSQVKDKKWRGREVNYYVEKEYEPYVFDIFGHTPEMLEFYSNKLGVEYPWNKYSQVVVRDYVSGAMENATAVIHGEFLQSTRRELLDDSNEDVIAHELFHHWFGDYVTCESWSNLPLNESFATYGEYLWNEHKYGREAADKWLRDEQRGYFGQAQDGGHNLINFNYQQRDDMFDGHSYNKGGCILHMLRKHIGDEAFFAALKRYLETNKFKAVEAHQLRLAFEEVTGQDLNWFFNQWFYAKGHPELIVRYEYIDSSKSVQLYVRQTQNLKTTPLFRIPVDVDIYVNGKTIRHRVELSKASEQFSLKVPAQPQLVNFDAEKMILGDVTENKNTEEWIYQYYNAPLYLDRLFALNNLSQTTNDSACAQVIMDALNDRFWSIRNFALTKAEPLATIKAEPLKQRLLNMAAGDKRSLVRANAISALSQWYGNPEFVDLYKKSIASDSSYSVIGEALMALAKTDTASALQLAQPLEKENSTAMLTSLALLYSEFGNNDQFGFYAANADKFKGWSKLTYIAALSSFLYNNSNPDMIDKGLVLLEEQANKGKNKYSKFYVQRGVKALLEKYLLMEETKQHELNELKKKTPASSDIPAMEQKLQEIKLQKDKLNAFSDKLAAKK